MSKHTAPVTARQSLITTISLVDAVVAEKADRNLLKTFIRETLRLALEEQSEAMLNALSHTRHNRGNRAN